MFGRTHMRVIGISFLFMMISIGLTFITSYKITILGHTAQLGIMMFIISSIFMVAITNGVGMIAMLGSIIFPSTLTEDVE